MRQHSTQRDQERQNDFIMDKAHAVDPEVVELRQPQYNGHYVASEESSMISDERHVLKIGQRPTVPRSLNKLIGLIGVNSSIVCPWPNFYFVAALNLGNGGTLGLLIGTIAACFGMAPVYLSMAEKMRK